MEFKLNFEDIRKFDSKIKERLSKKEIEFWDERDQIFYLKGDLSFHWFGKFLFFKHEI